MDEMEYYREDFCESKIWKVLGKISIIVSIIGGIALALFIVFRVFMAVVIDKKVTGSSICIYDYDYELNEQDLAVLKDESFFERPSTSDGCGYHFKKAYGENVDNIDTYGNYYTVIYFCDVDDYGVGYPYVSLELTDVTPEIERILLVEETPHVCGYDELGYNPLFLHEHCEDTFLEKITNIKREDYFDVKLHINSCDYSMEELEEILKGVKFNVTFTEEKSTEVKTATFEKSDVDCFDVEEDYKDYKDYNWRAGEWIFRTEHGKIERAKREGLPEGYYY